MTSKSPYRRHEKSTHPYTSSEVEERASSSPSSPSSALRRRNNNITNAMTNTEANNEMDENDEGGGSNSYCMGLEVEDGATTHYNHRYHRRRRRGGSGGGAVNETYRHASLDDFMTTRGPPSITIRAAHLSPDKTASTVVRWHRYSEKMPVCKRSIPFDHGLILKLAPFFCLSVLSLCCWPYVQ